MLNWVLTTFQKLAPSTGAAFSVFSQASYRALRPTWPVALSLFIVAAASAIPDQGRAIVKFTARASFDTFSSPEGFTSLIPVALLVVHSIVMMYTAFILSAVTRRNYLDVVDHKGASSEDPVDPSIELRLGFAYFCGVFLPLLFMSMSIWFQFGFDSKELWWALPAAVLGGWLYRRLARWFNPKVALKYAAVNDIPHPDLVQSSGYRALQLGLFLTRSDHGIAQAGIAGTASALALLQIIGQGTHESFMFGTWTFFGAFVLIHFLFRFFNPKVIRLHQGQTSRYIIIDPKVERTFNRLRKVLVFGIIILLWIPWVVNLLGPLGVCLIGTLWITLVLSGLTERAARHVRSHGARPIDQPNFYSAKLLIFSFLMTVLIIDSVVSLLEITIGTLRFNPLSLDFLGSSAFFVLIAVAIWKRKEIWGEQEGGLRIAIGRLPTITFLSPLLFLSYGEAHHVHRMNIYPSLETAAPAKAQHTSDAQSNSNQTTGIDPRVLSLEDHANAWVKVRKTGPEEESADTSTDGEEPTTEPVLDTPAIPAIIVLAEGGGIRAGAHAGYFLSHLDTALMHHCGGLPSADRALSPLCKGPQPRLLDHVFSINGVSGGSVGSAVYLAAVHEERQQQDLTPGDRHDIIDKTLRADYMSPLFAGLFGGDVLTAAFPVQLPDRVLGLFDANKHNPDTLRADEGDHRGVFDRADFFECRLTNVFEAALREQTNGEGRAPTADLPLTSPCDVRRTGPSPPKTLDLPLEHIAYMAGRTDLRSKDDTKDPGPIVFFSTFYENGGFQMATSNVDVMTFEGADAPDDNGRAGATFCGSVPIVQQLLYAQERTDACHHRELTLPLSAAAHLSARFPGSNPTGVIETRDSDGRWERHFFVDGGYLDNSGTLTAIQSLAALRSAAEDHGAKLNVIVLHLHSLSIAEKAEEADNRRPKKQDEILKVPSAVLKARGAASRAPIRMLCNSLTGYTFGASGMCDEIFDRRAPDDTHPDRFTDQFSDKRQRGQPVLHELIERLPLRTSGDPHDSVIAASWIPVPLEVAQNDRQTNATTALLGWTLLEDTSNSINCIMHGTANLVGTQIVDALNNPSADPDLRVDHLSGQGANEVTQSHCSSFQ